MNKFALFMRRKFFYEDYFARLGIDFNVSWCPNIEKYEIVLIRDFTVINVHTATLDEFLDKDYICKI